MTPARLAEIESRLRTWETAPADGGLRDAWAEFRAHVGQDVRDLLAEVRSLRAALARANEPTWPDPNDNPTGSGNL